LFSTFFFRKEHFFHDGFLMVAVWAAGSFGASFGVPAGSSTQCHGDAENRVLKRVGGKKFYYEKDVVFIICVDSFLQFNYCKREVR
jgi:hypothetical protein